MRRWVPGLWHITHWSLEKKRENHSIRFLDYRWAFKVEVDGLYLGQLSLTLPSQVVKHYSISLYRKKLKCSIRLLCSLDSSGLVFPGKSINEEHPSPTVLVSFWGDHDRWV